MRAAGRTFLLIATSLSVGCQSFAGDAAVLAPVQSWHTSYLVLSNVTSSSIYAMNADGTFKVYRPSH
jgi:hypothetical protein